MSRRIALVIEYEGTNYRGFQLQASHATVQGALEQALNRFTGESIRIRGASRTDSGAHAYGQVVDFATNADRPLGRFAKALNYYLPADIRVQAAHEMAADFHSRRDACSREYRYQIVNRESPSPIRRNSHHWITQQLNVEKMSAAAQDFIGIHDFRPFGSGHPKDKSAVRQVTRWDVTKKDDTIVVVCEANGFLRHQIRRANGLLVEIGRERQPDDSVRKVLENRVPVGIEWTSLPARGLCLVKVNYNDFWSKVRT